MRGLCGRLYVQPPHAGRGAGNFFPPGGNPPSPCTPQAVTVRRVDSHVPALRPAFDQPGSPLRFDVTNFALPNATDAIPPLLAARQAATDVMHRGAQRLKR